MFFNLDSTFKRAIFIASTVAISIIFVFAAFFFRPNLNQQSLVIYLMLIQAVILATFFKYKDGVSSKNIYVKKLKNPRLQENAFIFTELLIKEFDYIRDTAKQAMDDRHTMVNYFLIIIGAVVTVFGGLILNVNFETISPFKLSVVSVIAIIVNIIGWIYFMQLVRLRQSWRNSAAAMNQIKEFYIVNGRVPDDIARSAFIWDSKTLPKAGKKSNLFYYSAMLISFISSVVFLAASWLLVPEVQAGTLSIFSLMIALYHFLFQMSSYSLFLDYEPIH